MRGEDLTEESFLAAAVEARKRGPLVNDVRKGVTMKRVYIDPETNMVRLHGCYDVHWADFCLWVWEELPSEWRRCHGRAAR